MKKIAVISLLSLGILLSGCTARSTQLAQLNYVRVQEVKDGVVHTLANALSRENYETAKLNNEIAVMKYSGEELLARINSSLKEFAQKRDSMTSMLLDNERANTLNAVTVGAKLWSEQGILNYLGEKLSTDSKKFWNAWDAAKQVYITPKAEAKTSK